VSLSLFISLHLSLSLTSSIKWLSKCQQPNGGFGGGPQQEAHVAPTYAAVMCLCIIGTEDAYNVVNRETLLSFFMTLHHPNGGMMVHLGGEVDTRGSYLVVSVASLLNMLSPELSFGIGDWLAKCQTHEGGMGGEPGNEAHGGYAFCAFAALVILDEVHKVDVHRLLHWAAQRQMPLEGGFQGRTNKLVDGCYSYWVGGLFPLVDAYVRSTKRQWVDGPYMLTPASVHSAIVTMDDAKVDTTMDESESTTPTATATVSDADTDTDTIPVDQDKKVVVTEPICLFNAERLQQYILICCQHRGRGGLKDKPGKSADYYHSCYCLSGLATAQQCIGSPDAYLGGSDNELEFNHPLYNISHTHAAAALKYFAQQPVLDVPHPHPASTPSYDADDSSADELSQ
jgi:prenyltransferase beta subunit